jgi:hypothetical protein
MRAIGGSIAVKSHSATRKIARDEGLLSSGWRATARLSGRGWGL